MDNTNVNIIVSADDFGFAEEINNAVAACYFAGVLTSASLMATGGAFNHAVRLARICAGLDIGVHLVLVGDKPLLSAEEIPTLCQREGSLHYGWEVFLSRYLTGRINLDEVEREMEAQIARIVSAGLAVSHIDSHQHVHMLPGILDRVMRLAVKFRIPGVRYPYMPPALIVRLAHLGISTAAERIALSMCCRFTSEDMFRRHGVRHPQFYCNLSGKAAAWRQAMLTRLPAGIWEMSFHPATGNHLFSGALDKWGYDWEDDFRFLLNGGLRNARLTRPLSWNDFIMRS